MRNAAVFSGEEDRTSSSTGPWNSARHDGTGPWPHHKLSGDWWYQFRGDLASSSLIIMITPFNKLHSESSRDRIPPTNVLRRFTVCADIDKGVVIDLGLM